MGGTYPVRQAYVSDTPVQLLSREVTALLGVSSAQAEVLGALGIETVLDLGASFTFGTAHTIVDATAQDGSLAPAPGDFVDAEIGDLTFVQLAAQSPRVLRMVTDTTADALRDQLGAATLSELASWPPYAAARRIVADAYGDSLPVTDDPGRPDDLVPVARRYATERVQYDVIVLDKVLEPSEDGAAVPELAPRPLGLGWPFGAPTSPGDGSTRARVVRRFRDFGDLPDIGVVGALGGQGVDIRDAGGVDVSGLVAASLIAQPALGAVLTYRQSWFPHGLALGHLLHSMALAPGESTRIAMVDWTRRVRASTDEATAQLEQVASDVSRTRALSEVTDSVAKEAQSGFSESASEAIQKQKAQSYGESKATVETKGILGSLGASLFGGELGGPKVTSLGMSSAEATSSGWASSKSGSQGERSLSSKLKQDVTDRTQQAASSSRNRRASTVVETSQQEGETLTTRVVTNYNHMHALTVEYFEVVQVYRVVLELSGFVPCLFVPMKLVSFNERVIARYKSVLASAGLKPEVEALAFVEQNQLALYVPRKTSFWDPQHLAELRQVFGHDLATPASSLARLDLEGLTLRSVGSFDQDFTDKVDAIEVTLTNGQRTRLPVAGDGTMISGYEPRFSASLTSYVPRDIASIGLVRKDKEFEGDIGIGVAFEVSLPNGTTGSALIDAPQLYIGTRITCHKEDVTPAFELSPAIGSQQLLDHLEENALHYSTAIWRSMDAATITTLLATYTINGERLIEVIDPVPVTVSGNYLVFRYPGLDTKAHAELRKSLVGDDEAPTEDLVPLPSGGVYAEAVLGRSNAAEKLDITRFWNWQDSPIPILPAEINPLTAGGKSDDEIPETGRLESPIVTVVTPPALPDPAGLAPLYQAIANGNMFRDMSGLAQTAALIQAAMQHAEAGAANATDAAGEAQKVAAQQLTELLKLAAQVALTAFTGGAGAAVGAAGAGVAGALGSAKPGVSKSSTNAGALINHGKDLDQRRGAAGAAAGGTPTSASGAAAAAGGALGGAAGAATGNGAGGGPADGSAGSGSNELTAFETALGTGGGGPFSALSHAITSSAIGATGSTSGATAMVMGATGGGIGSEPTISEARAAGIRLQTRRLSLMAKSEFFGTMTRGERETFYNAQLGPFSRQLQESAAIHKVPVQLLASTIFAELIDINKFDVLQEELFVLTGSLGIAQIQIKTAIDEKLFTDITKAEERAAYEDFLSSPLVLTTAHAISFDLFVKEPGDELKLATNRRLRTPQFAIDAAARYIGLHLVRAAGNRSKPWATRFGFKWTGAALAAPQDLYGLVGGADQQEREANLAAMTAGIHNTPSITSATAIGPADVPNALFQADSASEIAKELFDLGLFRPTP